MVEEEVQRVKQFYLTEQSHLRQCIDSVSNHDTASAYDKGCANLLNCRLTASIEALNNFSDCVASLHVSHVDTAEDNLEISDETAVEYPSSDTESDEDTEQ